MNIRQSLPRTPSIASWNMSLGTKEAWGQGGQWAVRPFVCWIITIQISMTSFTHACPLYALAISDGPNSWVGRVGRPFCRVHTPPGSCVGSGHSEEQGSPYLGGQVTNSRPGKPAHLINLFSICQSSMLKIDKHSYAPQKIFPYTPYTPEFYLPCEVYPLALGHLLDFVEINVSYDFTNQQEIVFF